MCRSSDCVAARAARRQDEQGVALITALAMLVLFSLLGSAYLGYMLSDRSGVTNALRQAQARQAAEAGIYAAIGDIQRAMHSDGEIPSARDYAFPVYQATMEDSNDAPAQATFAVQPDRELPVTVSIADENARININLATRGMLERILDVDRATARRITSELPRAGDPGDPSKRWFTSVEELVSRGYMSQAAYDAIDTSHITVYTGEDFGTPLHYINLNTASPAVIAAVLNISDERAAAIAQARPPLSSLADLASAAGQDPAAFNTVPDPTAPQHVLPSELTTQSHTFRVVSTARFTNGGRDTASAQIEAVVLFRQDGRHEIRHWTVTRGALATPADVETSAPDEALDAVEEPMGEAAPAAGDIEQQPVI